MISRPLPHRPAWLTPRAVWSCMPRASKIGLETESVHLPPQVTHHTVHFRHIPVLPPPECRTYWLPDPLCRQPKILGVTLDTHFTFSPHVHLTGERACSRLSILKALAGVSWGQSKEVFLLTYRTLIKPILSYAAPIWFPNASTSALASLRTIQNLAPRIATGSLRMASVPHLHQEAEILEPNLCSQFLLWALIPEHPSHDVVAAPSGPCVVRHTL